MSNEGDPGKKPKSGLYKKDTPEYEERLKAINATVDSGDGLDPVTRDALARYITWVPLTELPDIDIDNEV